VTDAQTWRISQLEKEIDDLKQEVARLNSLRDQLIGMGDAARLGIKVLVALGGLGAIDVAARIIHWLNAPLK
jgi:hypothetical protein